MAGKNVIWEMHRMMLPEVHHLDNNEKLNFILELKNVLKENGKIVIADISFQTKEDMEKCKKDSAQRWDEDEVYLIGDEATTTLRDCGFTSKYTQVSSCAGVLEVS